MTSPTPRTYQQALSIQEMGRECGVRKMERYDDCILLTTGFGTTKVSHNFFKFKLMIVRKGNAP